MELCATCDVPLLPHVGRGRPRRFCPDCVENLCSARKYPKGAAARSPKPKPLKPCVDCGGRAEGLGNIALCPVCRAARAEAARKRRSVSRSKRVATCEWCSKEFHPRKGTRGQSFCSIKCANRAKAARSEPKSCPVPWKRCLECERWFVGRGNRKLCSEACSRARLRAGQRKGGRWHRKTVKPAAPREVRICRGCDVEFEAFVNQDHWYCSRRCTKRAERERRRAVKKNAYVEDVWRGRIFERDGWICQLCGKKVPRDRLAPHPLSASLDHIVPLAAGGTHEPANVQLAHFRCNSLKGAGGVDQLRLVG